MVEQLTMEEALCINELSTIEEVLGINELSTMHKNQSILT